MKNSKTLFIIFTLFLVIFIACSSSNDSNIPEETITETDYDISSILTKFEGTGLSYAVNGNTVTFTTQDLPNHTSPYWPTNNPLYEDYNGTNSNWNQNPNSIGSQNIVFTINLNRKFYTKVQY